MGFALRIVHKALSQWLITLPLSITQNAQVAKFALKNAQESALENFNLITIKSTLDFKSAFLFSLSSI